MPDHAAERLIADRYALAVPIGQGGMGVVWRARDALLGREVAIKEVRLPPTIPDSERSSIRARVLREARAAARLNHPGAVTLYDVINEQGHAFIVMELIDAPTLAQVVGKEGPLDPFRVAKIGAQVAAALAAAHQAGIVHRDVKPANVMVVGDGAKLTDFGIARVKGDPKLTSTGLIVGSPAYMAPEQASGAAAGPEADMWSLGATLYYAVEGRPPFERDGQIAVMTAVVNDPPRAVTQAGPLAPIIEALLSKDPNRRPSASELRTQLERLAAPAPQVHLAAPSRADSPGPSQPGARPAGSAGPTRSAVERPAKRPSHPRIGQRHARHGWTRESARDRASGQDRAASWGWPRTRDRGAWRARGAPGDRSVARRRRGGSADRHRLARTAFGRRPAPAGLRAAGRGRAAGGGDRHRRAPRQPADGRRGLHQVRSHRDHRVHADLSRSVHHQGAEPHLGATLRCAGPARLDDPAPPGRGLYGRLRAWLARLGTRGRLFKVQSSDTPSDPMQAWTAQERTFSDRPGYQRIRLEPGRYKGLDAAVWEFTQLEGGQRVHKLDITFKSADGRWGYAVLLQAPEQAWSSTANLSGQFERAFAPSG